MEILAPIENCKLMVLQQPSQPWNDAIVAINDLLRPNVVYGKMFKLFQKFEIEEEFADEFVNFIEDINVKQFDSHINENLKEILAVIFINHLRKYRVHSIENVCFFSYDCHYHDWLREYLVVYVETCCNSLQITTWWNMVHDHWPLNRYVLMKTYSSANTLQFLKSI